MSYIRDNNWTPVPVPFRQKGPMIKDWPALRLTEQTAPQYFGNGPVNIGVILGAASGHLTDVDLDCPEALAVAAAMLPPTHALRPHEHARGALALSLEFPGRHQGGHRLRRSGQAARRSQGGAAARAAHRRRRKGGADRISRIGARKRRADHLGRRRIRRRRQTSTAAELTARARRLAAAALLIRYWPPKGNRHDLSLALGGMLARGGWDDAAIKNFVGVVVQSANDPRPGDRVRCALDAAANVADAQPAYGFPKLKELLGDAVAGKLAEWLGCGAGSAAQAGPVIRCGAT